MDEEIIKKLQSGDADSFAWLVEEYKNKILNTCYRFLYNREDAEDVSQEVFIEVFHSIGTFRQEAELSTWIYRIVVTKSLNFVRKKNRKKRVSEIRNFLGRDNGYGEAKALEAHAPGHELEQEERLKIMQDMINSLPEKQSIAITLSKCEGFGNREIAKVMGITLPAVDALIHRAKANLRKQLTQYFEKEM
jgi:RNA polymerase sigma-70 factor (ECF subfamily)